jgi:hypothetical protein
MKRSRHLGIHARVIGLPDTVVSISAASLPIPYPACGDNGRAGMRARLRTMVWCLGLFFAWSGLAGATDRVVSTCTEAAFNTAFNAVNTGSGGTITFSCTGTIAISGSKLVTSPIVIDGGNQITFSLSTYIQVSSIGGSALTLKNLTLKGISGSTHKVENFSTLNIDHVTATQTYGNDSFVYNAATLSIVSSTFSHNNIGGGSTFRGTALYNEGGAQATITASTFDHNIIDSTIVGDGGAIYNNGDLNVISSTFTTNSALHGGAIANDIGTVVVSGSTFTGNDANGGNSPGNGGAISNESGGSLYVSTSTFASNKAFDGGAIRGDSDSSGKIHIVGSTFTSNNAVYGGAIENFGNELRLTYDKFNTNTAANIGGALWSLGGLVSVNWSEFTGNTAVATGGAIHCDGDHLNVYASTFSGNTSNVPNTDFLNHGGAVYSACYTVVSNSTFYNNSAVGSEGGAIYFSGNQFAGLYNATIVANQATEGAAISSNNSSSGPQLNQLILSGNTHGHGCSGGPFISVGYSLADDADCGVLGAATDHPNVALPMGAFTNNGGPTRTILPPPIATNNIPLAACIYATDQRSALRKPSPPGGQCDSGAVEVGGVIDEIFADAFELP